MQFRIDPIPSDEKTKMIRLRWWVDAVLALGQSLYEFREGISRDVKSIGCSADISRSPVRYDSSIGDKRSYPRTKISSLIGNLKLPCYLLFAICYLLVLLKGTSVPSRSGLYLLKIPLEPLEGVSSLSMSVDHMRRR